MLSKKKKISLICIMWVNKLIKYVYELLIMYYI